MQLAEHYKYITIVILLVMLAIEILRLYLGYEGNLREKVNSSIQLFNLLCQSEKIISFLSFSFSLSLFHPSLTLSVSFPPILPLSLLQVPELAGFWILSLFQLPLVVYLMANINTVILPLEWAICIPLVVFLLVEIIIGLRALQLMVRAQAVKFQLSQIHPGLEMRERRRKRRRLSREGGGTDSDIREHET